MADTPRVTVPVEPTPDLTNEQIQSVMLEAIREVRATVTDHVEAASMDADIARLERGPVDMGETGWEVMRAAHRRLAMLSAAPAPEGGAVSTGAKAVIRNGQIVISVDVDALPLILSGSIAMNAVAGAFKVTDAATFAKEVCCALNAEKEDGTTRVHMMLDSAFNHAIDQGAEGVDEINEDEFEAEAARLQAEAQAALATREEAPAEAGELAEAMERLGSAADFLEGDCVIVGDHEVRGNDLLTVLSALRAQPQAREGEGATLDPAFVAWLRERDCLPNDDDGTIEWADIVCALNDLEADLTPAREDAQPVAWRMIGRDGSTISLQAEPYHGGFAHMMASDVGCTVQPLYTHPAPDALRVAVAALKPFAKAFRGLSSRWEDHETHWQDATSPIAVEDLRRADQALAALQAEQGAK